MIIKSLTELTGLPTKELLIFITVICHIAMSAVYRQLKVDKNSPNYQRQIFIRKLFGFAVGMITNLLLFNWKEIVFAMCSLLIFYILSRQCTSPTITFRMNFLTLLYLCTIHIYRMMYYYKENRFDINYVMTIVVPKQIYFNWYIHDIFNDQQMKTADKVKAIPSFFDYCSYTMNFIGALVTPVYSYPEYDSFIKQNYKKDRVKKREISKKLVLIAVFLAIFIWGGINSDYTLLETPEFANLTLFYKLFHIFIQGILIRVRFYIVWVLVELTTVIANLRSELEEYNTFVKCINPEVLEFGNNSKIKIDNWNISIQRWLKRCFYNRIMSFTQWNQTKTAFAVFAASAFWHGLYPTYYLSFFLIYLLMVNRKYYYKNRDVIWFSPALIERINIDTICVIFMRHEWDKLLLVLENIWGLVLLFPAYLLFMMLYVRIFKTKVKTA